MNASGFRVCVKELYETRYDPVTVNYAVVTGKKFNNKSKWVRTTDRERRI